MFQNGSTGLCTWQCVRNNIFLMIVMFLQLIYINLSINLYTNYKKLRNKNLNQVDCFSFIFNELRYCLKVSLLLFADRHVIPKFVGKFLILKVYRRKKVGAS